MALENIPFDMAHISLPHYFSWWKIMLTIESNYLEGLQSYCFPSFSSSFFSAQYHQTQGDHLFFFFAKDILICKHLFLFWSMSCYTEVGFFSDFPGGSDSKECSCNVGDLGSIPGLGRSPGGGNGNLLQYSCLENPMDKGAWLATVPGVAKSQTWLSD